MGNQPSISLNKDDELPTRAESGHGLDAGQVRDVVAPRIITSMGPRSRVQGRLSELSPAEF